MSQKMDGVSSAQSAYATASKNVKLNFEHTSIENCYQRIQKVAGEGGLSCQCNIEAKDVQILTNSGYKIKKSFCLNPYTDEPSPCYTFFWHKG